MGVAQGEFDKMLELVMSEGLEWTDGVVERMGGKAEGGRWKAEEKRWEGRGVLFMAMEFVRLPALSRGFVKGV